jgi:hypothetical protein
MKILIACEFSGRVRDAFLKRGHDAISCDLLPTESPGPHIQDDALNHLDQGWDLLIAHPPCTYLANSGSRWLYEQEGRWEAMQSSARFFRNFLDAPVPRVAVENPVMHGHALRIVGRDYDQKLQPWQFGHPETKGVCLWLRGLPALTPTKIMSKREAKCHLAPDSKDRWKKRSITYQGIATAMAEQWS